MQSNDMGKWQRPRPPSGHVAKASAIGVPILCAPGVPRASGIFNGKGHPAYLAQVVHPRAEVRGGAPPNLPDGGPTVLPLPCAHVLEMTAKSKARCPVGPHDVQGALPPPVQRSPCPFPRVLLNGKECVLTPSTIWDGEPPHPRDMYPLDVMLAISTNGWTTEETEAMIAECRRYWAWKDGFGGPEARQQRRDRSRSRSQALTLRELLRNF